MMPRTRIIGLCGFLPGLLLASCVVDRTDEEIGRAKIKQIEVDAQYPLVVGESRGLPLAIYADADGNPTGVPLNGTWLSRDPGVASVSPNGSIVAGLTPGSTYIVITDGSLTDSSLVTVSADFFVWPDTLRLIPGASRSVSVASAPAGTVRGVNQTSWESLDPSVATVASNGVITATGTGQTSIVAHRGTFTASTSVRVAAYPKQLTFTDFGIGPGGVCALEADGTPWCWGQHQPVDGTGTDRCGLYPAVATRCSASPIQMSTQTFAQILSSKTEAGPEGSSTSPFALTADGRFYRLSKTGPVLLASGMQFQTALGGTPYCGVAMDNHGYCWGYNANGEMGIGSTQSPLQTSTVPVEVGGGLLWKYFVHAESMCGLDKDGLAWCWGPNVNYETGTGTTNLPCLTGCVSSPLAVKGGIHFTQLAAGVQEVCGTSDTGALYCWGRAATDNGGPIAITSAPSGMKLFGNQVICGIAAAGDVYCMRFPNEPPRLTYQFAKLALPFKAKKIVTGDGIACALSADDGRLYCWGSSNLGAGQIDVSAGAATPVEVWGQR